MKVIIFSNAGQKNKQGIYSKCYYSGMYNNIMWFCCEATKARVLCSKCIITLKL